MTADVFRKDKYLRASGYNFYVWAVVNLLVTLPLFSALEGHAWPPWLAASFPLGLMGTGTFGCALNDRRFERKWGGSSPRPVVEATQLWIPLLLLGFVLTALFAVRGPVAYVQPLWLLLVGAGYLVWGRFGVHEFVWLGAILLVAGAVAGFVIQPEQLAPGMPSREALIVWVVFMGILWIPFGAYVNWKYVHVD